MSQVISTQGFVPDPWQGCDLPALASYEGGPAVRLEVTDHLAEVAGHFDRLRLIVIPFASSADGRGFSLAAALRQMGYRGHLRAEGHVLVDQFRAALRAGFDDIEISDAQAQRNPEPQWLAVPMARSYQSRVFASAS